RVEIELPSHHVDVFTRRARGSGPPAPGFCRAGDLHPNELGLTPGSVRRDGNPYGLSLIDHPKPEVPPGGTGELTPPDCQLPARLGEVSPENRETLGRR